MILANGTLLPDQRLAQVLDGLEEEINETLAHRALETETVVDACARLLARLENGELSSLLARYATPNMLEVLERYRPLLRRESLEYKLAVELGGWERTGPRPFGRSLTVPLGTLFHVTAGNLDGLPAFSALEGLLTGNVNLVKLPSGDPGLSLALMKRLTEEEPRLAPFLYAFDIPSQDAASLRKLAGLADGAVIWGGVEAVKTLRQLVPAGCRLIEWGHRLSFAYLSGRPAREELDALAAHIVQTGGLLCSSCQVVYLDTDDFDAAEAFCRTFLPVLERAAQTSRRTAGQTAQATLYAYETFLEKAVDTPQARVFRGRGCSLTLCPDEELELSPLYGNVLVKRLPQPQLLAALRRQKGQLQTAGLLCPPEDRENLTELLLRAGLTRVTSVGHMSAPFPGEAHDGMYPLRQYLRVADVEDVRA